MTIRCVARVIAQPGKTEALRGLLMQLLEPTRKEAGCVRYQLMQNTVDPTDFTFVEEWRDEAAIALHMNQPHVREVLAKVPALLRADPDIRTYRVIG
jgi:quinol monooxygenase YgiN